MPSKSWILLLYLIFMPLSTLAESGNTDESIPENGDLIITTEGNDITNTGIITDQTSTPENTTLTGSTQTPVVAQKVEVVGTPLSSYNENLLSDSIDDLKFLIRKELVNTPDINNINTAHEITQRIKNQLLEQTSIIKNNVTFSSSNIYYNAPKEDIIKLEDIFRHIGLYKGDMDGKYDSIVKIVQKYQLTNNIVKSPQETGYGRVGPKTKIQLSKDYLQAIDDKIYQEILAVVKEEVQKTIDAKKQAEKSQTQTLDTQNQTTSITGSQVNDANISTGEIQKMLENETKISNPSKLDTKTLQIFIWELYGIVTIFAIIGYVVYKHQRRKKISFLDEIE